MKLVVLKRSRVSNVFFWGDSSSASNCCWLIITPSPLGSQRMEGFWGLFTRRHSFAGKLLGFIGIVRSASSRSIFSPRRRDGFVTVTKGILVYHYWIASFNVKKKSDEDAPRQRVRSDEPTVVRPIPRLTLAQSTLV